jgi:DNA polymerase-4
LRTAYKLCPHATFLSVDYEEYSRVSGIIKDIFRRASPVMEDAGIDEAFLEVSDIADIADFDKRAVEIAREIKQKVKEETGLTCSIGIAPNKLLAKIASDMQKPDGVTVIRGDDIASRIWPLPVRKLWGVGPKTEAYLKKMEINTIGELAALSPEMLIDTFGESYGKYLYEASRGRDNSPLVTHWEPKSISRETTFQSDTDNWQTIAKNLAALTRETVAELKERGYRGKNVTVKIRFDDFKTYTRAKTMDAPSDVLDVIRKTAFFCLGNFELKNKKVRLVGVRIGGLVKT